MTAEDWAVEAVGNKLVEAGEQGKTVTEAEMREEFGIGHEDLTDVLNALREDGRAVNELPAEWRAPREDETEGEGEPDDDAAAEALDRFDGKDGARGEQTAEPERGSAGRSSVALSAGSGNIVLTKSVLAVMSDETIGKMVRAGVESADGDDFTLRVEW